MFFLHFKVTQTDKEISNNSQSALKGHVRHGSCKPKGVHACSHFSWRECFLKQPELHATDIIKWHIIRALTKHSEKMRQVTVVDTKGINSS